MATILVTGGTGDLGQPTVAQLQAAGHQPRVLSRKPPQPGSTPPGGLVLGDLATGEGVRAALDGVDTVVHLATTRGRGDLRLATNLVEAISGQSGVTAAPGPHLVLISIVGIDEIPVPFYRTKLEIERLVSAVPHTILRATQFHNLVDDILNAQKLLPVLLAPTVTLQPIAVEDVAHRLTELAGSPPSGRVPDIGGPEQLTVPDLARAWRQAKRSRRPIVPLRIPGKTFRAYASGAPLVAGPPYGRVSFVDFLRCRFAEPDQA